MKPYDFAPVDAALERRLEPVIVHGGNKSWQIVEAGDDRKADLLGIDKRTLRRWRRDGLDEYQADRVAVALGTHPSLIWGQDRWREEGLTVLDDVFVNHGGWRPAWEWMEAQSA